MRDWEGGDLHQDEMTDFERMVKELQQEIFEQELVLYPDTGN